MGLEEWAQPMTLIVSSQVFYFSRPTLFPLVACLFYSSMKQRTKLLKICLTVAAFLLVLYNQTRWSLQVLKGSEEATIDRDRPSVSTSQAQPLDSDTNSHASITPFHVQEHGLGVSGTPKLLFHFILTTETLTWKMARSFDTVFYHHPDAQVWLHTNTLQNVTYIENFQKAEYNITLHSYNLTEMLLDARDSRIGNFVSSRELDGFLKQVKKHQRKRVWKVQQSDLLRFLLLLRYGGIYFDLDMYLQQPIHQRWKSLLYGEPGNRTLSSTLALAWQQGGRIPLLNCNAMIASKPEHPYLASVLRELIVNFEDRKKRWGHTGPNLVTSVYQKSMNKKWKESSSYVRVLPHTTFQPVPYDKMDECFQNTTLEYRQSIDLSRTLAFHTNNQMSGKNNVTLGTLCGEVYFRNACTILC